MKCNNLIFTAMLTAGISVNSQAEDKGVTDNQICKAGIAKVMGRNPSIIKVDRVTDEEIYLSYVRQDEQTKWKYKCKVEGSLILWGSDTGRWRTHTMDSKVSYSIGGGSITVTDAFSDGSSSKKTYTFAQLGN